MPFIKTVQLDEAEGPLKALYDEIVTQRGGRLPRAFKSASLHPEAVRAVRDLSFAVTFGASTLGRRREELLATFVSWINECDY